MPKLKKIRKGDVVTVRRFEEISGTLDVSGSLDGLPFLPEMIKYCGQSFRVRHQVNKLIQEGAGASMRRIRNVVLLDGTLCNGQAHDGCQRACFPLWKTAWLRPWSSVSQRGQSSGKSDFGCADNEKTAHDLLNKQACQVTELIRATTALPLWHPLRHYWDLTSRTYSSKEYLTYILGRIYLKTIKRILGKQTKTKPTLSNPVSSEHLDLQAGDLVEVKTAAEIRTTLNAEGKSRGLYFMPGMWEYCGRRLRVLQPVHRMMSERTGEIRVLSQIVILEGVTCNGKAHGGCQRGCYVFWKDIWLRRADGTPPTQSFALV